MLHLPAIAHECGIELDLDMSNEISSKTPNLCHLAPAGDTYRSMVLVEQPRAMSTVSALWKAAGVMISRGLISFFTGDTYMEDLEGAGGVHAVMMELDKKGLLDTSVLTCTGKTLGENLEGPAP